MKYKINTIKEYKQSGKSPSCIAVVYPPTNRPGMSNIAADFIWRRTVTMNEFKHDTELLQIVINAIQSYYGLEVPHDPNNLTVGFSRHAGCGMCPCSPGIVIKHKDKILNSRFPVHVWLDYEEETEIVPATVEAGIPEPVWF